MRLDVNFMMRFDAAAGNWDTRKRSNRAAVVADEIRAATRTKVGASVMEYGCGTGLVSLNLADHFGHITLMDSSSGMLDVLTQKIQRSGHIHMHPVAIDLTKDAYTAGTFDVIYTSMVLHHIRNIEHIIQSFYSLLNPGGTVCIVDLDEDDGRFHSREPEFDGYHGFSHDVMTAMLAASGFEHISIETFFMDTKEINDKVLPYSLFCALGTKV